MNKKIMISTSGILLISVLGAALFLTPDKISSQNEDQIEAVSAPYDDIIEGFSSDTKMIARYMPQAAKSYEVQYTLERQNYNYIDITLKVDPNNINALLSGLPTNTKVSLKGSQEFYYKSVPTDWAGRLVLTTQALDEQNICFSFEGLYDNQTATLCHTLNNEKAQVLL